MSCATGNSTFGASARNRRLRRSNLSHWLEALSPIEITRNADFYDYDGPRKLPSFLMFSPVVVVVFLSFLMLLSSLPPLSSPVFPLVLFLLLYASGRIIRLLLHPPCGSPTFGRCCLRTFSVVLSSAFASHAATCHSCCRVLTR
jgi:hypothetical protein